MSWMLAGSARTRCVLRTIICVDSAREGKSRGRYGRREDSLQQERIKCEHADRSALCKRSLPKPPHIRCLCWPLERRVTPDPSLGRGEKRVNPSRPPVPPVHAARSKPISRTTTASRTFCSPRLFKLEASGRSFKRGVVGTLHKVSKKHMAGRRRVPIPLQ